MSGFNEVDTGLGDVEFGFRRRGGPKIDSSIDHASAGGPPNDNTVLSEPAIGRSIDSRYSFQTGDRSPDDYEYSLRTTHQLKNRPVRQLCFGSPVYFSTRLTPLSRSPVRESTSESKSVRVTGLVETLDVDFGPFSLLNAPRHDGSRLSG